LPYKILSHVAGRVVDNIAIKVAVSEAAREFISSRFPGEYRIIPNGVNIEAYSAARGRQTIPGRILFIGRAEPRKGLHILLHAFNLVRERIPRASLVVAGSGWSEVKDAASKAWSKTTWPIPGVIALGRVPHQTKIDEMAAAEVLAVPSLEGESFGLVLTEGMAAGLPVVASDLAAYRSVLGNGQVGRLFPTADPYALADELVTVLQNHSLQRELIAKGIQAAEEFSWGRVVDQVILTYEETLAMDTSTRDRQPSWWASKPNDQLHAGVRKR
jgi:phosphatidylinositol alpha-mannosyltransferase